MKCDKALRHLELCKEVAENHRCEGQKYMECELAERIKIILILNKHFRKNNGAVKLGTVKQLLDEGVANAILLLIGDERPEAKRFLVNCMIDPRKRNLFYYEEKYFSRLAIGPFFSLFAKNLNELLSLFFEDDELPLFFEDDELEGADGEFCLANHLFSERFFMHYGENVSAKLKRDIVREVRNIIEEACGRDIFSDTDLIFKIYSAMLAEGTVSNWNKLTFSTSDIISYRSDDCIFIRIGNEDLYCQLPGFIGNDEYFILLDPQNWKKKFAEISGQVCS